MNNPLTNQAVSNEALESISSLAKHQLALERAKLELESQLEDLNESLRKVSEVVLPEAMASVGMTQFKLEDGTSVTVSPFYSAKIPDDKQHEAFAWLRSTNNDGLIKREIKAFFGKGEDAKATLAFQALIGCGVSPIDKQGVHPQTLKAFVRECIETGKDLPTDLFGVFVGNRTKITPAKE